MKTPSKNNQSISHKKLEISKIKKILKQGKPKDMDLEDWWKYEDYAKSRLEELRK